MSLSVFTHILSRVVNHKCNPFTANVLSPSPKAQTEISVWVNQFHGDSLLLSTISYLAGTDCSSICSCRFTYSEDQNYGPYLESVNGVAGNDKDQTYWQLLKEAQDGTVTELDVGKYTMKMFISLKILQCIKLQYTIWIFFAGIGCYIPSANETIILKFTKYWRFSSRPTLTCDSGSVLD